jgi:ParB/RepB/Spo0J family partition protein
MNNDIVSVPLSKLDIRLKRLRNIAEHSVQSMVMSLKKRGQLTPVVAARQGSVYILIDGFKRQMAAEILNLKSLLVIVVHWEEALQKAQMYLLNKNNGFTMIEEGLLIRELVEKDGLNQSEVATLLERHKSFVSRRLAIIRDLSPQVLEDIKLGLLPGGSALSLARLPHDNQAEWDRVIQTHRLKAKECRQLIDFWLKAGTHQQKQFLLDFPQQALEICQGDGCDTDQLEGQVPFRTRKWFSTLRSLGRVAAALVLRSKKQLGALDEKVYEIFFTTLRKVEKDCEQALEEANEILTSSAPAVFISNSGQTSVDKVDKNKQETSKKGGG